MLALVATAATLITGTSHAVGAHYSTKTEIDSARVAEALQTHGVVGISGALSQSTAATLLTHVNQALDTALSELQSSVGFDMGDSYVRYFGDVLRRENRHDLKLDLTPVVTKAVEALTATLGPTITACLGDDAVLYELAALISDPQSPQQPFHPDTPFREDQGLAVLTAFVALQPIDEAMGPTRFIPSSHTAAAHAAFNSLEDGGRAKLALLRSRPCWRGVLDTGDVTLFDSRLLHCGSANSSPRRRVLFYVSFRKRQATAPPGTLLYSLRERHSLADFRRHMGTEPH